MKINFEDIQVYDFSNLNLGGNSTDNCFGCDNCDCDNCDNCDCDCDVCDCDY